MVPGDLLLLHEATADPLTDKTELVVVQSIIGSTIHLRDRLQHDYSDISAVQVVYVPQYSTLTVPDGSSIIAGSSRNGYAGIVAIRVTGSVVIDGTISARMAQPKDGDDTQSDDLPVVAAAVTTSTNGLILLLVPNISGHGTIHAYSGKSFDLDSDDCGNGDCDGVVVVGGKTSLSGITIHAKSILFAGIAGRH
jgi:hypothetical protein